MGMARHFLHKKQAVNKHKSMGIEAMMSTSPCVSGGNLLMEGLWFEKKCVLLPIDFQLVLNA